MNPWMKSMPEKFLSGFGLVRFFALIASGISIYLLYHSVSGSALPGCGMDSGCGTVMSSRWAYVLGWPVSLPALLLYGFVLGASALLDRGMAPRYHRQIEGLLVFAATALILAAIWFIGLQLFVIYAICPFCMAAHVCGLVVGGILLKRIFGLRPGAQRRIEGHPLASRPAGWAAQWGGAGLAATAILAAGQIFHQPKSFDVQSVAPGTAAAVQSSPNSLTEGFTPKAAPAEPASSWPAGKKLSRTMTLHGGIFNLDMGSVPLMGSPEAPHVIVHLFDYSCEHCRHLHPLLVTVSQALSNQLAIISLPAPLATNCNHLIKRVIPEHTNACEYARVGLAVWRADPSQLPRFEDWIFAPSRPPSPEAVRAEARALVGSNAFERALQDPWIEQQMENGIRILGTNYARYRKGQLPQLMIGSNIVSGVVRRPADLYRLLTNQFVLEIPAASRDSNAPVRH